MQDDGMWFMYLVLFLCAFVILSTPTDYGNSVEQEEASWLKVERVEYKGPDDYRFEFSHPKYETVFASTFPPPPWEKWKGVPYVRP